MVKNAFNELNTVAGCLIGMLALGMAFTPLEACSQAQQKLTVSATVLKRASLRVLAQPSAVVVTAGDIARGYVDVAGPAKLAIRNNSTDGFMLAFAAGADFLKALRVQGLGAEVQMGPEGGFVRHDAPPALNTLLDLQFRLELSSDARPGVYAWPVQLSVIPL